MSHSEKTDSTLNVRVEKQSTDALRIKLAGDASEKGELLNIGIVGAALEQTGARLLSFESTEVTAWDSRFVAFIRRCAELCKMRNVELRDDGLPQGVRRLLRLAQAVPERTDARHTSVGAPVLRRLGEGVLRGWRGGIGLFTFLGENLVSMTKLLRVERSFGGRMRFW